MNDDSTASGSVGAPAPILERLEGLLAEIRRQGRASIAAQAAAESCAASVAALQEQVSGLAGTEPEPANDQAIEQLVRALMPFADAIDRMSSQASRLAASISPPGRLARMLGATDATAPVRSLADGLTVLGSQLDAVLRNAGVEIDREVGVPIDGDAHRVVEARPARPGDQPGTVLEVVRPGYSLLGKRLREADVVAARGNPALP
ncbi:MAG: nucleotide exchange factor GrpE [Deltaproteobacteria bacterium]|nr:nucleotide exchange factor GrpE [Deltaproteobacteria bacterium]